MHSFGVAIRNNPPFAGKTTAQLVRTNHFLLILGQPLIFFLVRKSLIDQKPIAIKAFHTWLFSFYGNFTARTAYNAAFVNYDDATEFLVYAHAARGPKDIMEKIEDISIRTTRALDVSVAYDNHSLYPFWWYLRHYRIALGTWKPNP